MRVLILSAIFACAFAAPSELVALSPVAVPAAIVVPEAPTVSPGDVQAAEINAKVEADDKARAAEDEARILEDQARQAADQARELTEIAAEAKNEAVTEINSEANEKTLEAFWATEEKKWQALEAVQTAEAQVDGAVARDAPKIARSAVAGVVGVYPPVVTPFQPVISPIVSPIVYASPGFIAPIAKIAFENTEEKKSEATEKVADEKTVESSSLKTTEKTEADKALEIQTSYTNYWGYPSFKIINPLVTAPLNVYQPGLSYSSSSIQQFHGQAPYATVIKTQW